MNVNYVAGKTDPRVPVCNDKVNEYMKYHIFELRRKI